MVVSPSPCREATAPFHLFSLLPPAGPEGQSHRSYPAVLPAPGPVPDETRPRRPLRTAVGGAPQLNAPIIWQPAEGGGPRRLSPSAAVIRTASGLAPRHPFSLWVGQMAGRTTEAGESPARRYLSPQEFSELSGLSLATVRRYLRSGRLPSRQPAGHRGRILIPADALELVIVATPPVETSQAPAAPSTPATTRPPVTPARPPGPRPRWTRPAGPSPHKEN